MMLLSYTTVDFYLFYDGAVDIQIWALLTRSQCTLILRWPLRSVGILFTVCVVFGEDPDFSLCHSSHFIWQLLMSDFCVNSTCHFLLPNGQIYTNGTMIKILKEKTFLEIRTVLERINKCQLCDLEIGLLCAILLIDAGNAIFCEETSIKIYTDTMPQVLFMCFDLKYINGC